MGQTHYVSLLPPIIGRVVDWCRETSNNVAPPPLCPFSDQKILGDSYNNVSGIYEERYEAFLDTDDNVPLNVLLIQIFCAYAAYIFGKFACKVQIQGFR